jgi:FtsH-binding integral membrane protein
MVAASMFGAMAVYGYVTKKDLSAWGSFLMMGLVGIIVAAVVNIFVASSMMSFVISVVGVIVFTGLTAYDVQKFKSLSAGVQEGTDDYRRLAIIGALSLYLDFINLFIMLVRLLGNRD